MPITGVPCCSAWWTAGLPPLQITIFASAAISAPREHGSDNDAFAMPVAPETVGVCRDCGAAA